MMKDDELFSLWNQNSKLEKKLLEQAVSESVKSAQNRSKDVFSKIRRNIIFESIPSILIAIVFPFLFLKTGIYFWLILILMIISLFISVRLNLRFLRDLKSINETSVLESLEKKMKILKTYIKRLKTYFYLISPIAFALGMGFSLQEENFTLPKFIFIVCFSLPFLFLFIWIGKKYIYLLYGKHLDSIKGIHDNLNNGI